MKEMVKKAYILFAAPLSLAVTLYSGMASAKGPRLISSSPSLTELVFQLDHGSSLVATSDYSNYPSEAQRLPHIGSLFLPNLERIIRFEPDWILIDSYTASPQFMAATGKYAKTTQIKIDSVNALFKESKRLLFEIFGESSSKSLNTFEEKYLAEITKPHSSFNFLILVWMKPIILYGQNLFLTDLIAKLGGRNLMAGVTEAAYPQVSEEWLVKHAPDVLFYLQDFPEMRPMMEKQSERWWPSKKVLLHPISGANFARTSFTPLLHLSELAPSAVKEPSP